MSKPTITDQEVIRIIQTAGYRKATESLKDYTVVHCTPDTLQFMLQKSTGKACVEIHKNPDGTIDTAKNEMPQLWNTERKSIWLHGWHKTALETTDLIWQAVEEELYGPKHNPNQVQRERISQEAKISNQGTVEETATRTANGAMATLGLGYIKPSEINRYAHAALYKFLDSDILTVTRRIAGCMASIEHYNFFVHNRELMEAAFKINPNATTLWASYLMLNKNVQYPTTPEELIQTTRQEFETQPQWETFLSIPNSTVKSITPAHDKWKKALDIINKVGQVPSATIVRCIIQEPLDDTKRTMPIFREATRLSRLPKAKRTMTIRELAKQFKTVSRIFGYGYGYDQTTDAPYVEDFLDAQGRFQWEKAFQHVSDREGTIKQQEKEQYSQPDQTRTVSGLPKPPEIQYSSATAYTLEVLTKHLVNGAAADVTRHLRNTMQVQALPGQSLVINTPITPEPTVEIFKAEDNTIQSGIHYTLTNTLDPDNPDIPFSSRDIGQNALAQVIADVVTAYWPEGRTSKERKARTPQRHDILRWMEQVKPLVEPEALQLTDDATLTQIIRETVNPMIDPEILNIAQQTTIDGEINFSHYNNVASSKDAITPILDTNLNVVIWYLHTDQNHTKSARHPGQVISEIKQLFTENGFDPKLWKRFVKTDIQAITSLLNNKYHDTISSINKAAIVSKTGTNPHPNIWLYTISQVYQRQQQVDLNTAKIMELLLKESTQILIEDPGNQQYTLRQQFYDARDYANAMTAQGEEIKSKNWNNLVEKSRRWHRINANHGYANGLNRVTEQNQGHFRRWPAAISKIDVEGAAIRCLNSDQALQDESNRLSHCVSHYGSYCIQGNVRIFSIEREDGSPATVELMLINDRWEATQIRTVYNQITDRTTTSIAEELANRYTEEWAKMNREEHDSHELIPLNS